MPPLPDGQTTLLVISSFGIPPYSARGLSQSLEPVDASKQVLRTINGGLRDFSFPQFRKYRSEIQCRDMNAPALSGVWPGRQIVVDCVAQLSYLTAGGAPEREVVPGSSYVEGDFTFYRPRLTMRILSWNQDEDEYGAAIGWTLELEED